jgi:transposase
MLVKKYIVKLSQKERKIIKDILHKGSHLASVRNRAQTLCLSADGMNDEGVKKVVGISINAICEIRKNFCLEGFERAVFGKKRSGRPPKFDANDEAQLTALACSNPPNGYARWSLELLKSNMKKPIGKSSVHLMLKKTRANRGNKKCGVLAK